MSAKAYAIYDDARNIYFKSLPLGMFWECVNKLEDARKFPTRAAASKMMRDNGKHREGWRVIPVSAEAR